MKNFDFAVFLYEKIVIATLVSAVSAFLLYTYNIHSKAFEAAESQSKGYSTLAIKLRDLSLTDTIKVGENIRIAYLKASRSLPEDILDRVYSLSTEISQIAGLLSKRAPKTASAAQKTSELLNNALVDFQTEFGFKKKAIDELQDRLAKLRLEFIENFDAEVKRATLDEFNGFLAEFEAGIPWFLRPLNVLYCALALFVVCTIGLIIRERTKPPRRGATARAAAAKRRLAR